MAGLEGAANPVAEIAERLAQLHAQKDATVETVFARLAPLEAKLAGSRATSRPATRRRRWSASARGSTALEGGRDPGRGPLRAADAALRPEGRGGGGGLRPLEARLAALERAEAADDGAAAARAEAQAIAAQLIAARTVAEETRLFASRIALLEASLPRLSLAQALMMQALERQAAPPPGAASRAGPRRIAGRAPDARGRRAGGPGPTPAAPRGGGRGRPGGRAG